MLVLFFDNKAGCPGEAAVAPRSKKAAGTKETRSRRRLGAASSPSSPAQPAQSRPLDPTLADASRGVKKGRQKCWKTRVPGGKTTHPQRSQVDVDQTFSRRVVRHFQTEAELFSARSEEESRCIIGRPSGGCSDSGRGVCFSVGLLSGRGRRAPLLHVEVAATAPLRSQPGPRQGPATLEATASARPFKIIPSFVSTGIQSFLHFQLL